MIEVSAAIIRDSFGRVLLCRRASGERAHLWEFPGGKIEHGETPEACLVRECREELNIEIKPLGIFRELVHEYPDRSIKLFFIDSDILSGTAKALEHEAIEWVKPAELCEYELCGADKEIALLLCKAE